MDSCPYQQLMTRPSLIAIEDTVKNASSCFELLLDLESLQSTWSQLTEDQLALAFAIIFRRTGPKFRDKFSTLKTDAYKARFFHDAVNRQCLQDELKKRWLKLDPNKKLRSAAARDTSNTSTSNMRAFYPLFYCPRPRHVCNNNDNSNDYDDGSVQFAYFAC